MYEFMGSLYVLGKGLVEYLAWKEEDKLVDNEWLEDSGFGEKAVKSGLTLRWSRPEKIESRLLKGYEVLYEVDKLKRKRRRLILNDGSVLIGKHR